MKNFQVINLGCKVNAVESANFVAGLLAKGYEQGNLEDCELVIVNTCTVTSVADKKSRKAVRHALKHSKGQVFVTGCSSKIDAQVFEDMDARVKVCPKAELLKKLNDAERLRQGPEFKTRVGIKIQDGCDNACTYCLVRHARGRSTSLPFDKVLAEAKRYIDAGVRELVLSGINIGAYNYQGKDLADLLAELCKIPCEEPYRFRISSIEPQDVSDAVIKAVKSSEGKICKHFHLPLQSGSSKVLHEMNRKYTAEEFQALVDKIYTQMPDFSISTDIIVCFPGETEEDFQKTLELAKACRFSKIHVFPYSKRQGTPAASRKDQIEDGIKAKRVKELSALGDKLRAENFKKRSGSPELCLVQEDGKALTESYFEITAPKDAEVGQLVKAPVISTEDQRSWS